MTGREEITLARLRSLAPELAGVALVVAGSQPAVALFLWPAAGVLGGVVISRYRVRPQCSGLQAGGEADSPA
ncbi:hypothetical protein ABGB14_04060 [Nonomuraea sp. B10E15]|uniref:hypothetical protein n=1 Tax=unclassified Nonomuraea TaxID=2593643 RepID=UPI00325D3198